MLLPLDLGAGGGGVLLNRIWLLCVRRPAGEVLECVKYMDRTGRDQVAH